MTPAAATERRGAGNPVPGRRRRPGGQGRQLPRTARCGRSGRAGRRLRRRRRGRAGLPRHHGVQRRAADDARGRRANRGPGLHPADRGRRSPQRRGRGPAAAGRGRQGIAEHGGDRPARPADRGSGQVRLAVRGHLGGRQAGAGSRRRVRGDHPRRTARDRAGRGAVGRHGGPAWCRGDPAELDGRRRDQGGVRPAADRRGAGGRRRAGHRQRRSRAGRRLRPRRAGWRGRGAGSEPVPFRRAADQRGEGVTARSGVSGPADRRRSPTRSGER